jgi:hypothetical protein
VRRDIDASVPSARGNEFTLEREILQYALL